MESCLSRALIFLPKVNNCCVFIKNMKLAGLVSSIVLFMCHNISHPISFAYPIVAVKAFPPDLFIYQKYYNDYYFKISTIAKLQLIILYIFLFLTVIVLFLNICAFFSFCLETQCCNVMGLLFVLVSLLALLFEVIYILIVFIRGFSDPGFAHSRTLLEKCSSNYTGLEQTLRKPKKIKRKYNESCYENIKSALSDSLVLLFLLPITLYIYLLIVINSAFKDETDDDD